VRRDVHQMSTVYQPADDEHVSRSVNSKRHGLSYSTKQGRKAMRPGAHSWLLLRGPRTGLLIFHLQLVHHLLHVGNG
jgi:hypothetical protein